MSAQEQMTLWKEGEEGSLLKSVIHLRVVRFLNPLPPSA